MKFAFETLLWGRRIDDLDAVLEVIASFGYQGIELAQRLDHVSIIDHDSGAPKTLEELGAQAFYECLKKHRLELAGIAGGTLKDRFEFCRPCHELRPFLYVEDLEEEDELLINAIAAGFIIAVHPHWFKKIQRIKHAEKVIKDRVEHLESRLQKNDFPRQAVEMHDAGIYVHKSIKLLPDTAHMTIAGDEIPIRLLDEQHLAGVHLKDWDPCYGRYSHRYAQGFKALSVNGKGLVKERAVEILRILQKRKYNGWVVIEQDAAEKSIWEAIVECTKWLRHQNKKFGLQIPHKPNSLSGLMDADAEALSLKGQRAERAQQFLQTVLPSTVWGPRKFYQCVTDAFMALGDYITVQIFDVYFRRDELYRLGASTLPELDDEAAGNCEILNTKTCLCGRITRNPVKAHFNLRDEKHRASFQDQKLLEALETAYDLLGADKAQPLRMLSLPIFNSSNPQHLRYVLNVFPKPDVDLEEDIELLTELKQLGRQVSRLADHVSDEVCSSAYLRTAYLHEFGTDGEDDRKRAYFDGLRDLIQSQFKCKGVTILLEDETGEHLKIVSTTGVAWRDDIEPHERHYTKGETQTGEVWATGEILLISNNMSRQGVARSKEIGKDVKCKECMYAPIGRPGKRPVGVVRIVDREEEDDGCHSTTMFTDDDAAVLDAIIQAALAQIEILILQERQMKAISSMTHEFKYPLNAINGAVDRMRGELRAAGHDPASFWKEEDFFEAILDWSRFTGNLAQNARLFSAMPYGGVNLNVEKVSLLDDIIQPAVKYLSRMLKEARITDQTIEIEGLSGFPILHLDRGQMLQVAFNLISNAIKYRDKKRVFRMRFEGWKYEDRFIWQVSDWGMGVPDGMGEAIFQSGFRTFDAQLRDVRGQGIGLAVVRSVLKAHEGEVRLISNRQPTCFEVSLPEKLCFQGWAAKSDSSVL